MEEPTIPDDIAGRARIVREGGPPIAAVGVVSYTSGLLLLQMCVVAAVGIETRKQSLEALSLRQGDIVVRKSTGRGVTPR